MFPVSWNLCVWLHLSPLFFHAIAFRLFGMYSSQTIATLLQCSVLYKTQWIVTFVIPLNFFKFPSFLESLCLAALVTSLLPCCCLQTIWIYSSQIIATLLQCSVLYKTQWIVTIVIPLNFFKFPSFLESLWLAALVITSLLPCCCLQTIWNVFIPNKSNRAAMHCNLQSQWIFIFVIAWYSSIFEMNEPLFKEKYVHWNFVHYCIRGYFRGGFIFANFASQTSRKFPL